MKSEIAKELYLVFLILFISCGTGSDDSNQSNEDIIPEYQLAVVDSFGVEIGDSINMIGSIQYFCHHPNGSVLILDRAAMCLRVIPPDGQAYTALRNGEGPGELSGPQGLCTLGDGRILIPDMYKHEMMTYDEQGNYLGGYFLSHGEPPSPVFPVDSSSVVGIMFDNRLVEEETQLCYSLDRYNSSIEPIANYYMLNFDLVGWNEALKAIDAFDFYADRAGNVYIVNDFTEYLVNVYTKDALLTYQIEEPVTPLQKSEAQIQIEIDEYEEFAVNDASYRGGYQPPPYNQLISLAGVDSEDNLWIERFDSDTGYNFDVWDPNGELAYTVSFSTAVSPIEIKFLVDDIGIIGAVTDPDDYPRIYYFETVEI